MRLLRIVEFCEVYELVVILKDAGNHWKMYNYNKSVKSEMVPHNIFLALASTGSHILITPWMVPGL